MVGDWLVLEPKRDVAFVAEEVGEEGEETRKFDVLAVYRTDAVVDGEGCSAAVEEVEESTVYYCKT